jgi:cardiolipin synthase
MAYFSGLDSFVKEIIEAHKRGVEVIVMIPESANYQDATNKATVKKLMELTENGVKVYLSKKMIHTKMMITDDEAKEKSD